MSLSKKASRAMSLYKRSDKSADGWAFCSPAILTLMVEAMPPELIDVDTVANRIRLSERGKVIAAYM